LPTRRASVHRPAGCRYQRLRASRLLSSAAARSARWRMRTTSNTDRKACSFWNKTVANFEGTACRTPCPRHGWFR
jgi:hypothetical protein